MGQLAGHLQISSFSAADDSEIGGQVSAPCCRRRRRKATNGLPSCCAQPTRRVTPRASARPLRAWQGRPLLLHDGHDFHTLGNLTLLTPPGNASASKSAFADKLGRLNDSMDAAIALEAEWRMRLLGAPLSWQTLRSSCGQHQQAQNQPCRLHGTIEVKGIFPVGMTRGSTSSVSAFIHKPRIAGSSPAKGPKD
jgi:Protein of unknown function (DUF1524)